VWVSAAHCTSCDGCTSAARIVNDVTCGYLRRILLSCVCPLARMDGLFGHMCVWVSVVSVVYDGSYVFLSLACIDAVDTCIFIFIYIYIRMCVYIHIYIYVCVHIHIYIYIRTHIYIYVHIYIHVCMYQIMKVCIHTYTVASGSAGLAPDVARLLQTTVSNFDAMRPHLEALRAAMSSECQLTGLERDRAEGST